MKFNRQKIWFFSMIAIMLVLSAYYLFSEDAQDRIDGSKTVQSTVDGALDEQLTVGHVSEVSDQQVIEKLESENTEDFFTAYHMKQRDSLAKETDKYMKIITNPESSTQAISEAMTAMQQLEDKSEQVTELEEKLQQHFADVVVEENQNKWNVIVQSSELKPEQAVHIVQMATDHLKVAPDRVSVQYRQ